MARITAWEVLRSGNPTPLREVDRAVRRNRLDERDARLVRALIGLEVRRRGTLRALVKSFSYGKLKPDMIAHMHLGLVQLLFLDRIPDHAALSETADAVSRTLGQSKVRHVNGFLRAVLRERREGRAGNPRRDLVGRELHLDRDVFHDPEEHPLLWAEDALSMPAPLLKRWTKRYGNERALELARFFLDEPPLALRLDEGEPEALVAELEALDVPLRGGSGPGAFIARSEDAHRILTSDAFLEGRISIQGEHAQTAAALVQARPDERVLELCAAPGGKSLALARTGAHVFAADIAPHRLGGLLSGASRLRLEDRVHAWAGDGTAALRSDVRFDAVLVDAPCSNTGVLGARPAARWRYGPRHQASLNLLQRRLLREGAERVRPGGRLVWSTCSLEPEENQQLVKALLAEVEGWTLEEERASLPAKDGPFDGGYAARLRRAD